MAGPQADTEEEGIQDGNTVTKRAEEAVRVGRDVAQESGP